MKIYVQRTDNYRIRKPIILEDKEYETAKYWNDMSWTFFKRDSVEKLKNIFIAKIQDEIADIVKNKIQESIKDFEIIETQDNQFIIKDFNVSLEKMNFCVKNIEVNESEAGSPFSSMDIERHCYIGMKGDLEIVDKKPNILKRFIAFIKGKI